MFEGDTNIGLLNTARTNQFIAGRNARQADINLQSALEWKEYAHGLERRVAELEAALNLRDLLAKATDQANGAVTTAWRGAHPVSPLHDVVGKLRDGRPLKRNYRVWAAEFDAAARRLGITNPEAHRIS